MRGQQELVPNSDNACDEDHTQRGYSIEIVDKVVSTNLYVESKPGVAIVEESIEDE